MSGKDDKLPPNIPPPVGGKDREESQKRRAVDRGEKPDGAPRAEASIGHDDRGNAVWNLHVTTPQRRKDDEEINPIDFLDPDELSLKDDERDDDEPESFNPYDKS